jgi:hypothetical protein
MHEEIRNADRIVIGKAEVREHLGEKGVNGNIILTCVL